MAAARDEALTVPDAQQAQALPGRGVQAVVEGRTLALGSNRLLDEMGAARGALSAEAQRLEGEGRTVSWLISRDDTSFHPSLVPFQVSSVSALMATWWRWVIATLMLLIRF